MTELVELKDVIAQTRRVLARAEAVAELASALERERSLARDVEAHLRARLEHVDSLLRGVLAHELVGAPTHELSGASIMASTSSARVIRCSECREALMFAKRVASGEVDTLAWRAEMEGKDVEAD
jgi:hypothetical protein